MILGLFEPELFCLGSNSSWAGSFSSPSIWFSEEMYNTAPMVMFWEKVVLVVIAGLLLICIANPNRLDMNKHQRISGAIGLLAAGYFIVATIGRQAASTTDSSETVHQETNAEQRPRSLSPRA